MRNNIKVKQTEIGDGSAALTTRIPEGWELRALGSLGRVVTGKTPPTKDVDNFGEGYLFITPRDMIGQKYIRITERYVTEKGKDVVKGCLLPIDSVCVSCIGSDMGKVVMTDRPSITNQQLNSLICNQVYPHFVYYGIINITDKLRDAAFHSTAVPILNKSAFSQFQIPLPRDISKQRAIAKILSDLDEKIELNHQMNKTLEFIAQAIFKRWFMDFEFPDKNGKPYKSSRGKMVDSELGEIPEGWTLSNLEDIGTFKNGINYLRNEAGDTEFFIANVRDIANNKLLLKESLDKIKINLSKAKEYLLQEKDILIARSASPGEISLVLGDLEKVIYSGFSIRYRLNNPNNYLYIFHVMQGLKRNLQNYSIGTTLQSVNQGTLKNMKLILPSDETLKEFNKISKQILDKTLNNLLQNRELSQIRDSLLPRLISGRIRVG